MKNETGKYTTVQNRKTRNNVFHITEKVPPNEHKDSKQARVFLKKIDFNRN